MIDRTRGQVYFYRIVISPENSKGEQRNLPQITRQTMRQLQKILGQTRPIPFMAVAHTDHSQTPHVHALAILRTYISEEKLARLREAAEHAVIGEAYPQPSVQAVREYREAPYQRRSTGTLTRSTERSFARTLKWHAHSMPARQDIFIARATVTPSSTGSGGNGAPWKKVFVCPGCNQPSSLKRIDKYFECKKCGMEIGHRSNRQIFASR